MMAPRLRDTGFWDDDSVSVKNGLSSLSEGRGRSYAEKERNRNDE
jgi:hypothetical protein